MDGFLFFCLMLLVFLAGSVVFTGIKIVPQGNEWTVERFGRFRMVIKPGLNFIIPFVDRIGRRINVQEQVLDIPSQVVITRDNATVRVDGVLFYQVYDSSLAAYQVFNLQASIINLALTNLRTALGSMELDEVLSKRDEINSRLLGALDQATQTWGTKVTRVEIKDVLPPEDITRAMALQLTADREKRAKILEAEGVRQAEILRAEGMKQSAILEAEGKLAAARLEAEARERLAGAEAESTRLLVDQVGRPDAALQYFVAQRYVDALQKMGESPAARMVVVPAEISSLSGALGALTEILKQTDGKK
jgi:regulator of protease activity HflC (stomatin/prohibitin superfamily)